MSCPQKVVLKLSIFDKWVSRSTAYRLVQSICIHYSCFENMGRFVTLKKKSDPKYGLQKAGCKKQGHCYPKREGARLPICTLVYITPKFFDYPKKLSLGAVHKRRWILAVFDTPLPHEYSSVFYGWPIL